jgi:hypothetical protein
VARGRSYVAIFEWLDGSTTRMQTNANLGETLSAPLSEAQVSQRSCVLRLCLLIAVTNSVISAPAC